jgi:hypothetical protein
MNNPQLQNKNTGSDTVPKGKKPLPRNPTNKPTMKEEKIDEKKGDEGEDEVSLLGLGGADEENNKKDRTPGSDGEFDGGQRRQQEIIDRWESDCKYTAVTTTLSNQKMILQGWISTMEASFKETARRISLLKGPKTDSRVEASTCRIIFEVISKIMEYDRGFKTMVLFDIFPSMNDIMAQQTNSRLSFIGIALSNQSSTSPVEVIESEEMLDLRRSQATEDFYENEVFPALQKTKEFVALSADLKAKYLDYGPAYMLTLPAWAQYDDMYKAQLRRKVIVPLEKKRLADLERRNASLKTSQEASVSVGELTREREVLTGVIIAAEAYKQFHASLLDHVMVLIMDSPGLSMRARNQVLNPETGIHIASVTNPPNLCAAYYMLLNRRDAGIGGFQTAVIDIIMATNADTKAIVARPSLAAEEMQAHLKVWIEQDYCRRYCTTDVFMCIGLLQMIPFGTKLHTDLYDEFIAVYDEYVSEVEENRSNPTYVKGTGSVMSSAGQGISRFDTPMFTRLNTFLAKCTEKKDGLAEMIKVGSKALPGSNDVSTAQTHEARSVTSTETTAGGNAYPPPAGENNIWSNHTKIEKGTAYVLPNDRKFAVAHGRKTSYTATPSVCTVCESPDPSKRGHGTPVWCRTMRCTKCNLFGHINSLCHQTK